jgi:hypothetical protein
MKYDKETVVGVIRQIIDVREVVCKNALCTDSLTECLESLLLQSKAGDFNKPTLEEVWKERTKGATLPVGVHFVFDHDNATYITRCLPGCHWESPRKVIKL